MNPPANAGDAGDTGLIHGSGRSPRAGHSNPLQYSCLGKSMNRGAWRATVRVVTKSRTWLSGWVTDRLTETHKTGTSFSPLYKWGNGSQRDYIAFPSSHRGQTASGSTHCIASTQWQIGSTFKQHRLHSLVFYLLCLSVSCVLPFRAVSFCKSLFGFLFLSVVTMPNFMEKPFQGCFVLHMRKPHLC